MEFIEQSIRGVYLISLNPKKDERGFFMRAYDRDLFRAAGVETNWVQENHSRTEKKGVIRGLHLQLPPFAETKLVRCIRGAVFDVFVDLRANSPSFGKWGAVELNDQDYKVLLIPKGFAHGFCTLTDQAEMLYKVDSPYAPMHETGILWNDPDLAIGWPCSDPVLSPKDLKNLTVSGFIEKYGSITATAAI